MKRKAGCRNQSALRNGHEIRAKYMAQGLPHGLAGRYHREVGNDFVRADSERRRNVLFHERRTKMADKGPPSYRDSKSGEFVKPGYAKSHPSTTEKEHNSPPPKKK